jgi:hypothetical protein
VRAAALAALVFALAACGGGAHGAPDRFSGTWKLAYGRTIPIQRVSAVDGRRAMRALHATPCGGRAVYFRATYFGGVAHMAACATGDGRVARGRFDDNGITGTIVQRLTAPKRFVAVVHGDGHTPFRITAVRLGGG